MLITFGKKEGENEKEKEMKYLLVEDEEMIIRVLRRNHPQFMREAMVIRSGAELECVLAGSSRFEAVLCDRQVGMITTTELLPRIARLAPHVCLYSGSVEQRDLDLAEKHGILVIPKTGLVDLDSWVKAVLGSSNSS